MTSLVDQCRADLAKWEARAVADETALRTYERLTNDIRERLAVSRRCANDLRSALRRYEALHDGSATECRAEPASLSNPPTEEVHEKE